MSSRLTLSSFRGQLAKVAHLDVIHVDNTGIYASDARGNLEWYSHDPSRRIAKFPYAAGRDIVFVCPSADLLTYASRSMIYSISARFGAPIQTHSNMEKIQHMIYHPVRKTHLVACPTRIIEFDCNLRYVSQIHETWPDNIKMVPSDNSPIVYATWWAVESSRLSVIHGTRRDLKPRVQEYVVGRSQRCTTLLTRPEHPDILTLIYTRHIDMIDLWHSSASARSATFATIDSDGVGTHVGPNICIVIGYRCVYVTDVRCGLARTWPQSSVMVRAWFANSRIYVSGCEDLWVFD